MSETTVSAAGMRVVKLLIGRSSRTIGELISETGVTRTAVTEQLKELIDAGFVECSQERLKGRGRPRHRYSATQAASLLLFANNQRMIVPAIWKAIAEIGGESLMQDVLHSVSRQLAEHYGAKITATDPKQRMEQFNAVLEEEGGLVDLVAKDGQLTLTKRNCPFIGTFDDEQRHACAVDLRLMSTIAGFPVHQTSSRHDGAPCCQFEIDTRAEKTTPLLQLAGADG
jgi:DeoR family transcriptional regulator, suf operon transcriptional repressor